MTAKPPRRRDLEMELAAAADADRAAKLSWFFKTGKGQYGEGDRFLGITVPLVRKIALRYKALPFEDIERLLRSRFHECRFAALEILVSRYERGSPDEKQRVFELYLANTSYVNNWDLVDASAPYIIGEHVFRCGRELLYRLARSHELWERRMAIVATLGLIKHGELEETFQLAKLLLDDSHDLIHKATGWALREAGKVSEPALKAFLREHSAAMPRTALRYAIERFPVDERKRWLMGLSF